MPINPTDKADKPLWTLERQGKRLSLKCNRSRRRHIGDTQRGDIVGFSRKARARLLRHVAELNWDLAGEGQFVTLTYPDADAIHLNWQRTIHRSKFHRAIEKIFGSKKSACWRVEWKPRLTGSIVGAVCPHVHYLYLQTPTLDEVDVGRAWMRAIDASEFTHVHVEHVDKCDVVGLYVAKYCAKEEDPAFLVNVPYLNRTGRHWGWHRKKDLSWHEKAEYQEISEAVVEFLKSRAGEVLGWYDAKQDGGFTLLGGLAVETMEDLANMGLDELRE